MGGGDGVDVGSSTITPINSSNFGFQEQKRGGDGVDVGSSTITPINSSNIGFQLLKKHGWKEGTGLGISEQGRLEPIQTYLKKDKGGLGADEAINSIRCEICKINCNSRDVLEKHMLGKKHKRNVQMLLVSPVIFPNPLETTPNESLGQTISGASGAIVVEELETKKRKMLEGGASADSMIFCTVCNVACNSQAVFITHLSGRKHAVQVLENSNATNGNTDSTAPVVEPVNNMEMSKGEVVNLHELKRKMTESLAPEPGDIETKKRKILEGGAAESDIRVCVLCNVVCNSQSVFIHHLSGRKHAAQVLENSNATNGNTDSTAPIVEPVDNMDTSKGEVVDLCELKRKMMESSQTPEPEDIETKKRKIVEGGAAESDIRVCALCNVVCNSPSVFKFHLSGQKHAAMVKKQAEAENDKANVQAALLFKQTLYGKKNLGGD